MHEQGRLKIEEDVPVMYGSLHHMSVFCACFCSINKISKVDIISLKEKDVKAKGGYTERQ